VAFRHRVRVPVRTFQACSRAAVFKTKFIRPGPQQRLGFPRRHRAAVLVAQLVVSVEASVGESVVMFMANTARCVLS
jgi:hypothetical protein